MKAGNFTFSSPCSIIQARGIILTTLRKLLEINKSSRSVKNQPQTSSIGNTLCCWGLLQPARNCKFKTSLPRFLNGRYKPKPGTSFAPTWVFASLKHHSEVWKTKHCSHFRTKSGGRREEYHSNQCLLIIEAGNTLNFSLSTQTSLHPSIAHQQIAEQG